MMIVMKEGATEEQISHVVGLDLRLADDRPQQIGVGEEVLA